MLRRRPAALGHIALVPACRPRRPAPRREEQPAGEARRQGQQQGHGTIKNGKVDIEADNYYFEKTFLKGTAGDVTVEVENEGSIPHSFTIDDQNIDEDDPARRKTTTVTVQPRRR